MGAISAISRERSYSQGQLIYYPGQDHGALIVVHTGSVKIYRLDSEGNEQVIRILSSGEFAGEMAQLRRAKTQDFAPALRDSTLCMIDGEELGALMLQHPAIGLKFTQELSRRLSQSDATLHQVVRGRVEQRLAKYLLELYAKQGKEALELPITKGNVASLLAMSQATLSRTFKNLEAQGLITLGKSRKVTLINIKALHSLVLT
ncbi:MAG: Crp/Fnr family transcriptional regulator [Sphaerochaetaceae bacterium]